MQNQLGKLYVVATPIGNLMDVSRRTQEILSRVTWIAAEDTRHSRVLLNFLGITTPLIPYHEHNERACLQQLIQRLEKGELGALISDAGTPLISDPGYALVRAAHLAGIQVCPIPGPCSVIAALSVSGLPTDRFLFEGFLPAKTAARQKRLMELSTFPHTIVFLEAPHRALDFFQDAVAVLGETRVACIARELTKTYESVKFGDIKTLMQQLEKGEIPQKGEFVMMIEGCEKKEHQSVQHQQLEKLLPLLLAELSLKQSVMLAKTFTGLPKSEIYDYALQLNKTLRPDSDKGL